MSWRPIEELPQEVTTEEDLTLLREELVGWMHPGAGYDEETVTRLHSSPNPHFKKLAKDYEEQKHRARTLPVLLPMLVEMKASWRYINYGFQFKFPQGGMLCWWPRTGAIDWQGRKLPDIGPLGSDVVRVLELVKPHLGDDYVKPLPAPVTVPTDVVPTGEVLACLVCGGANVEQTCADCTQKQTDLCAVCFPRAHWCLTGSAA